MNYVFVAFAVICLVRVLWWMIKTKGGGRAFLLSAAEGTASLFAVNLAGALTGVTLAVNWAALGICGILGMPGVIMMLFLNYIFR